MGLQCRLTGFSNKKLKQLDIKLYFMIWFYQHRGIPRSEMFDVNELIAYEFNRLSSKKASFVF